MNTSTKLIEIPIDYRRLKWENITPKVVMSSVQAHYRKNKRMISQLENNDQSDEEFLQAMDNASMCCSAFNQLISFLLMGGNCQQ